jgi:hypothetical protein
VELSAGPVSGIVLLTDDEGAFTVRHLPTTSVTISTKKPGYLGDYFDALPPEARAHVNVTGSADAPIPVTLKLMPQAVIAGTATSAKGAGGALVRLWERKPDGSVAVHGEQSLDRTGTFRFAQLAAGRFYLEVSSDRAHSWPNGNPAYRHLFFKQEPALQTATPIDIQTGETRTISIELQPAQGRRIRGQLASAPPDTMVTLHLPGDVSPLAMSTQDNHMGAFTFSNIPPGLYVMEATWNVDGKAIKATLPVSVSDSDLDGIMLSP